jgi:amylosucrase
MGREGQGGRGEISGLLLDVRTDAEPKAYEKTLVEIFPADAPGNFTWYPEIGKWVWTTFNEHQWDLNWSNPEVFLEIVDVMLNLANRGVDVSAPGCRGLHVEAAWHQLPEPAGGA